MKHITNNRFSGLHSGQNLDWSLLIYVIMLSYRWLQTFWRNPLYSSSVRRR